MSVQYTDRLDTQDFTGEAYVFRGRITTIRQGNSYTKTAYGFRNDLDLALECYEIWKELGYKGAPSGAHSFFDKSLSFPRPPIRTQDFFSPFFHGAWIQLLKEQSDYIGDIQYYDMISAYMWAGISQGFPRKYKPYEGRDSAFVGIWENEIDPGEYGPIPHYFKRPYCLVTHQDVEIYGLKGRILWGVSWDKSQEIGLHETFEQLDKILPEKAFKQMSQSFWGGWASSTPIKRVNYVAGQPAKRLSKGRMVKSISIRPHKVNFVWACLIVHAVIRRCYQYAYDAILVSTDALLTQQEIPTGHNIGDWRLKEQTTTGATVIHANVWSFNTEGSIAPLDRSEWSRHAGTPKKTLCGLAGLVGTTIDEIKDSAAGKRAIMEMLRIERADE